MSALRPTHQYCGNDGHRSIHSCKLSTCLFNTRLTCTLCRYKISHPPMPDMGNLLAWSYLEIGLISLWLGLLRYRRWRVLLSNTCRPIETRYQLLINNNILKL